MRGKTSSREQVKWSVVEKYVSVYPAVNMCGVCAWYFIDGVLASLAFSSMPMSAVSGVLETYRPDSLVVEGSRPEGHTSAPLFVSGVENIWYVPTKWRSVYTSIPNSLYEGRISPLAHRAFSLGYHALVKNGGFRVNGKLPLAELTGDWLRAHGAKPIGGKRV